MILFDIETDGLMDTVSKVHCIVTKDTETKQIGIFSKDAIPEGLAKLASASTVVGHNILGYDLPVLKKICGFTLPSTVRVLDTLIMSRLVFSSIKDSDFALCRTKQLPGNLIGSHKLEAWGYRLGIYKGDFCHTTDWKEWSPEMEAYCVQDVEVTHTLFVKLGAQNYSWDAVELEHKFAAIIEDQMARGWAFDEVGAQKLYAELIGKRQDLTLKLRAIFPDWKKSLGMFTPKVNNKTRGYVKGVPIERFVTVEFNPASRDHIANRLQELYQWKPTVLTETGKPQVDEAVLDELKDKPGVSELLEYLMIEKRIGMIAEGDESWLKSVKMGRIYGYVNTNGARTGRCTHSHPNLAQVPRVGSPYGEECRKLFLAGSGYVLVGCDAEGLELRCLAHYMAKYDGGEYAKTVVEGKKEDGTDIHSVNMRAAGLTNRDQAKTFIYAFLYGAGDEKIGSIVGGTSRDGKALRESFLSKTPALRSLTEGVQAVAESRKWLKGLDGRRLHCPSVHSSLNTLLQSAGALVMKQGLIFLDAELRSKFIFGEDFAYVGNIHDEWQIESKPCFAETIGKEAALAITAAGKHFNFRCPLSGSYGIGNNWGETH